MGYKTLYELTQKPDISMSDIIPIQTNSMDGTLSNVTVDKFRSAVNDNIHILDLTDTDTNQKLIFANIYSDYLNDKDFSVCVCVNVTLNDIVSDAYIPAEATFSDIDASNIAINIKYGTSTIDGEDIEKYINVKTATILISTGLVSGSISTSSILDKSGVQADWLAIDGDALILNKPEIFIAYTDGGVITEGFEQPLISEYISMDGSWVSSSVLPHSGVGCKLFRTEVKAGTAVITVNLVTNGELSFWHRAVPEFQDDGETRISIDGVQRATNSSHEWQYFSCSLLAGIHTITFFNYTAFGQAVQHYIDDITVPADRVYHQGIEQHTGIPSFLNNGDKILKINSGGTALEYVDHIGATGAVHGAATSEANGFMSATDKAKLDGIEAGAGAVVQSDWLAIDGDALILNKPTLFTPYTDGEYTVEGFEGDTVFQRTGTWNLTATQPASGMYCLQSQLSTNGSTEEFILEVPADGILEFDSACSGHPDLDFIDVYLDNVLINRVAGVWNSTVNWSHYSGNITSGTHILKAVYNAGYITGLRSAFIDNISIPADRIYNQSITEHSDMPNMLGNGGKLLKVNAGGTGIEYGDAPASTFVNLTDAPDSYTGNAGKIPAVNEAETAIQFIDIPNPIMSSAFYKNEIVLVSEASSFAIGIPEFDSSTDKILIFRGGIYQSIPEDLTVTNSTATIVSGTWPIGTEFSILVIKGVQVTALSSVFYKNIVTLIEESTSFSIGIEEFDSTTDRILIYEGGLYKSIPEEITVTSTTATIVSGTWAAGTTFDILVIKNSTTTAANIPIVDESNHFTSTNVEGALAELFTSVSDGKTLIAAAITDKEGTADGSDTFAELANAIGSINTSSIRGSIALPGTSQIVITIAIESSTITA